MSDFDLPITMLSPSRHRRAVAQLVNQVRATHGLPPLRFAMSLRVSARAWAVTQTRNSSFGHGSWSKRVLRFPFVLAGRPRARWARTWRGPRGRSRRRARPCWRG